MVRFWLLTTIALLTVAASVLGTTSSYADSCSAIRGQLLSGGRGGGVSPELAQLRRQLAAIQGLERQRRCTAQSATGGFFNACADLARNRTEVQRRMAAASNSGRDVSGLQARLAALGCTSGAKEQRPASKSQGG